MTRAANHRSALLLFRYDAAFFNAVVTEVLYRFLINLLSADDDWHRRRTAHRGSGKNSADAV